MVVGVPFLAVAGLLVAFPAVGVVLDVAVLLAVEAEEPFLGGPRGVLFLLGTRGAWAEFYEPLRFVHPLFLSGNNFHCLLTVLLLGRVTL